MTSFVLVHGSGQNADSWSRVGELLRARGHIVAAPELPKTAATWRLEDHAARIAESITGPDAVVVAHSLCGAMAPLVPQFRECALLVFIAAVIPEPGKSIREQFTAEPTMFCPEWIAAGPRWFDDSQRESLAREFLFHDCDDNTLPWALRTVEAIDSKQLVVQPSPLVEWPSVPAVAIVAGGDRTLSPDWCRRISRRMLGTEAVEVQAGHCPQVSQPDVIAGLLEQLAGSRGSGSGDAE